IFCVGQQVTLSNSFNPPLPVGTLVNYQWIISLDFVNGFLTPIASDASSNPYIDSSLLTNNPTSLWWYDGGDKYLWCKTTIQLPDGETFTNTAEGMVQIFRPKVFKFTQLSPAFPILYNGYLELGDDNTGIGNMVF